MKNTRFMEVLFSAVEKNDEELTSQVAKDIEDAKANGIVDTDEVKYESNGDGKVTITDKETGEVTIAEKANDEDGTYDLYPAMPDSQIEGYVHPESDGVTPGNQVGAPDEKVEDHMDGSSVISPNLPCGGLNPEAGNERSVEELVEAHNDERQFSVSTDNSVVLRIFSDQEFCERVFSEVIESEETAKVGDLKVEKVPNEDAVVVTSENTGDQAKVTMNDEEMEVTELGSKTFSNEDQYEALHVVGVDPINHVIVDAPEYCPESAKELVERLAEQGVEAIQVFDNREDARDYALDLLEGLGVQSEEDIEEPKQVEFSDHNIYLTEFRTNSTDYMCRMFSESVNEVSTSQEAIEDAIENGEEIENDSEIITPIDAKTAIVEDKDNGEFTKAVMDEEIIDLNPISEDEAKELTENILVSEDEEDDDNEEEEEDDDDENEDEEKEFSDIYTNDAQTKFFSENENMTEYMVRLFSDEASEKVIEDAIENGDQIENEKEIITPVDSCTAVVEDKENGEFTKAVMDEDKIDLCPITEEEADKLTEGLVVDIEGEVDEDKEEEKEFSLLDKFFSEMVVGSSDQQKVSQQAQPNNPNVVPLVNPVQENSENKPTVEAIEDKALEAIQSIKEMTDEAAGAIMEAKEAPVQSQEEDLKEAQFSEKDNNPNDTLANWLGNIR